MTKKEYTKGAKDWLCYFLVTAAITTVFLIYKAYFPAGLIGVVAAMCGYEALCYWGSALIADQPTEDPSQGEQPKKVEPTQADGTCLRKE